MKKEIVVLTEEEILAKINGVGSGRSYLVTITKKPYMGCNIKASILNGKILNYNLYCGEDWGGVRYKTCKEAINALKDCEE